MDNLQALIAEWRSIAKAQFAAWAETPWADDDRDDGLMTLGEINTLTRCADELEKAAPALSVRLPQRWEHTKISHSSDYQSIGSPGGRWMKADDVLAMLRTAGIGAEGGE